jgi:hypothetical protein
MSKLTTYIHVPDFPHMVDPKRTDYHEFDFYIVTLRDVYTRFLSAFTFMHPHNPFTKLRQAHKIYSCYPTLESFTDALAGNNTLPVQPNDYNITNCNDLAWALVENNDITMHATPHFYFDTKLVVEWANIPDETPLLAVRTEHMWDDWITANEWIGQEPGTVAIFPEVKSRVFTEETYAVTKEVSDAGQRRLCQALAPGYQVYLRTILRAVNLSPKDKEAAFQLALENCGPEVEAILPSIIGQVEEEQS